MANLELITDAQAELVNGGRRHHRGSQIKLVLPNLTSISGNVVVILGGENELTFNYNPA